MSIPDESSSEMIFEVNNDKQFGEIVGCCKWFNKKLGYGFITVYSGEHKGSNIFVHHSGIKPLNSNFKTLKRGEYVSFNIINGVNGIQAFDVKGVYGGPLMCDNIEINKSKSVYPKNLPSPKP